MKIQFSAVANGMVWATLPLMGGLYYWEHTLRIMGSGHKMIQILLLPVVFGWAFFWNTQAEYDRLRHLQDKRTTKTKIRYHLVTAASFEDEQPLSDSVFAPSFKTVAKDEPVIASPLHDMQYPFEAKYHVSNN